MMRLTPAALLLLTIVITACDGSPVEPPATRFDSDVEFFLSESQASPDATPAERVSAAVRHAKAILERATEFVGDSPSAEVAELLAQASAACDAAESALSADRLRMAARAALRCAQSARMAVLEARSERREGFEARAEAAVEIARDLLAQATPLVTADAPDGAHEALARAEAHLVAADEALAAGRYREAATRARLAGSIAQRILRVLG